MNSADTIYIIIGKELCTSYDTYKVRWLFETDVSDAWMGFEEWMEDESANYTGKRYCSQK